MSFLVNPRLHMQPDNSPSNEQDYSENHHPLVLPKPGQTHCYWALLNSTLEFIYLDPVLASHLDEQADLLIAKSLLDFVHPDEQASAKQDIGGVVDRKTMHGSITRIRFSRLSRIRRLLGYDGPPNSWPDTDRTVDHNYMAVDIVTNWAAEGLVLCFIHAANDVNPSDHDERKSDWINWCETLALSTQQVQNLYRALFMYIPRSNMSRVFQILTHTPERTLMLSWPPEPEQNGPTGRDFAKLVETVEFRNSPGLNDAKTNCARRYRSFRPLPYIAGAVESIFIPHGSVIFACHKTESPSRNTTTTTTMPQAYSTTAYHPQQQHYYDHQTSFSLPPLASSGPAAYSGNYVPQSQNLTSTQRWSTSLAESQNMYHNWESTAHTPIVPPAGGNLRSGSSGSYHSHLQQWQISPPSYIETTHDSQASFHRPVSSGYSYPTANVGGSEHLISSDIVPPPRRRVSPGSTRDQYSGGRTGSNRPLGVQRCSSCKVTQSPEWRKGPTGKKELCNACGLRYARSRAKKEGHHPNQRRRKEKSQAKAEPLTPPNSFRRRIGQDAFSTSSTGSPSGSETYPHSGHPILSTLTPSPSPPSTNVSFVHYSPGGSSRQNYSNTTGSFYSVPSPLSNQQVLTTTHETGHDHPSPEQHANQLPPLGSYASRMSPMLPGGSSISHSPLTSTLPRASYERETDRTRDLPPTPVSAEPRQHRRSVLTHQ